MRHQRETKGGGPAAEDGKQRALIDQIARKPEPGAENWWTPAIEQIAAKQRGKG